MAIGMLPQSRLLHQDLWTDFCCALSTPGVVALGEIGLDSTLPNHSTQENWLENLLDHVTGSFNLVVVHCRGERKDHAQVVVNLKCLDVFKRAKQLCKLSASQRIHLRGLSQKFLDNSDNFVQTCEKSISRPPLNTPSYRMHS